VEVAEVTKSFFMRNGASVHGQVDVNKDDSEADHSEKSRIETALAGAPPKKNFDVAVDELEERLPFGDNAPPLEIIYDASGKQYYVRSPKEGYHFLNVEALRRHLVITHGLDSEVKKGQIASEVDAHIEYAENHNRVDVVGEFAGYREAKIYEVEGGNRLLIPSTKGISKIIPAQGDWSFIRAFLEGIIPKAIERDVLKSWLKNVWESMQEQPGDWWPQPALVIIGVQDCGKSAIQKAIITPILGRSVDPTRSWTGETTFNAPLGKAEHLVLDDPKWSGKEKKEKFVAHLKGAITNEEESIHPKGRDEFKLKVFRRITISINDEEEPMSIFPLMPDSTLDKLVFIRAQGFSDFTPNRKVWKTWRKKVTKQLPAFLWHLLNEYETPSAIDHDRYGVAYRNEEILARISAPTAEEKRGSVEELLWEAIFGRGDGASAAAKILAKDPVKLTATELLKRLTSRDFPLRDSLRYYGIPLSSNHLGRKLQALHDEQKLNGAQVLTIRPGWIGKLKGWEFVNAK
jgi:Family of unknown function (DUF5906)